MLCKKYGKDDILATMTRNLKWSEITANLVKDSVENRPDLKSRVFRLKQKSVLNGIILRQCLGKILAQIEFEKRGLPHNHILLREHLMKQTRFEHLN